MSFQGEQNGNGPRNGTEPGRSAKNWRWSRNGWRRVRDAHIRAVDGDALGTKVLCLESDGPVIPVVPRERRIGGPPDDRRRRRAGTPMEPQPRRSQSNLVIRSSGETAGPGGSVRPVCNRREHIGLRFAMTAVRARQVSHFVSLCLTGADGTLAESLDRRAPPGPVPPVSRPGPGRRRQASARRSQVRSGSAGNGGSRGSTSVRGRELTVRRRRNRR
jgi:hypothetical protein